MAKIVHHHLGLGDHFVCFGLVCYMASQEPVYLLTKQPYVTTVKAMYNGYNVHVVPVRNDADCAAWESHPDFKRLGFSNENEERFGEEFYKQAGVPYEYRWKYQIHRDLKREQELFDFFGQREVFIHDDHARGFEIPLKGFRPDILFTRNMLDYGLLIEHAQEIHCIESSFRLMIDFLNPQGKLNLHKAIKPQGIDTSFLVATLTAALQEAHSLIKNLETRISALEAK